MTEQRDKYIVEANFKVADEDEWDWLTEAFGATYCESEPQAMAIARFLTSHAAVEMVEVLHQREGQRLESIWCSDPHALQAARERLSRVNEAANILGIESPAFAEWLYIEKHGDNEY
uniref:Uncharacterized protein n=1 Tax=Cyanothece sp. (strain PCC 7425 / ATCC 29141) TaxID=395961 RepID=B8HTE5_CYAP4